MQKLNWGKRIIKWGPNFCSNDVNIVKEEVITHYCFVLLKCTSKTITSLYVTQKSFISFSSNSFLLYLLQSLIHEIHKYFRLYPMTDWIKFNVFFNFHDFVTANHKHFSIIEYQWNTQTLLERLISKKWQWYQQIIG